MSIALVIIKKDLGGHTWSNTHAVQIGAGPSGIPTDADLTTLGMASTLDATTTSSTMANFIQRLVAFERLLHARDVHFNTVYVTDGKNRKEAGSPTTYATVALDFTGLRGTAAYGTVLEVGAVAWLLHRNVQGFSHRPGRMFVRGALIEGEVSVGGARMIQWESTTASTNLANTLSTALTTSTLPSHYGSGTNVAAAMYGVPHYVKATETTDPLAVGDLGYVIPISGWTSSYPVNRQVQRGRKRKTTP